ncbi:MAG: MFS transporter, partial [Dehalococcoidia bacterium]
TVVAREPARALLMRQWIQPREIVTANALMNLLWGISAMGFILIPFILELLDNSWRNTMYLFGGVSLSLTILWQVLGRERTTSEYLTDIRSQAKSPIRSILKYKELWLIGLGLVGIDMTFSAMAVFWPSYMLETYDLSLKGSASIWAISGVVSSVTALGVATLVRKTGKEGPFCGSPES